LVAEKRWKNWSTKGVESVWETQKTKPLEFIWYPKPWFEIAIGCGKMRRPAKTPINKSKLQSGRYGLRQSCTFAQGWQGLPICQWSSLNGTWPVDDLPTKHMGVGQNLLLSILMGWTSIYQLFWGSLGARVLTNSHI
jgi:hypothetical protein